VDSGDSPWEGEILEDGLVQQVEPNVEGIPAIRPDTQSRLSAVTRCDRSFAAHGAGTARNGQLSSEPKEI
jgi:hypothetical protein